MRGKYLAILVAIVVLGLIVLGRMGNTLVDWLWFSSIGYEGVFWTIFTARTALFLAVFAVSTGAFWLSGGLALRFARQPRAASPARTAFSPAMSQTSLQLLTGYVSPHVTGRLLVAGAAVLLGLLTASIELSNWEVVLRFLHQVPYGESDPVFGKDIGFYLFSLPAYVALKNWLLLLLFFSAVLAGGVYWVQGDIELDKPPRGLSPAALTHGSVLLGLYFAVKAWSYALDRFLLLYSDNGVVVGAGYTDLHVRLPILWFLVGLAVLCAIAAGANVRWRTWRLPAAAALLLFASSIVISGLFPALFNRFTVKPSELQLETPYIERNIALTRQAYNLRQIAVKPFPAEERLSFATLEANRPTVDNIRLWDVQPLMSTYAQLQEIRTYYKFLDMDIDRYRLDGAYQQVMLSARELDPSLLPSNAQTWVNLHLLFTHGNGVVMSPVTQKSSEGLPLFYLQDIPPVATGGPAISEPRLYFGQAEERYAIVKGSTPEFDYPKGKDNVYAAYDGADGVSIGDMARRGLFSWYYGDPNILLTDYITSESRILLHRNIQDRVRTIAPVLRLDHDPYIVVSGGRLFWMQDAYTTSDWFPYAQPQSSGGLNYIRNSVKVVIDAYNGSVDFYVSDPDDPLIQTYQRIFPRPVQAAVGHAGGPAAAHPLPRGSFPRPGAALPHLSHGQSRGFLQSRGPLAVPAPARRQRRPWRPRRRAHGALLHDHAAARRSARRVRPHAADGAEPAREHDRLAGGALRSARLRQGRGLRIPQGQAGLRAVPDRGAHPAEHRHLAADLAVEPDGLARHPRPSPGGADRELDPLRLAALPARRDRPAAGAEARDRRLRRSRGDGGNAGRGAGGALQGHRSAAGTPRRGGCRRVRRSGRSGGCACPRGARPL